MNADSFRITSDVGGTFTDLVLADGSGTFTIGKAPTRANAVEGVLDALEDAAAQVGGSVESILGQTDLFIYSTTRSTNAILERKTAKTALLVTEGFPDTLVLREGGRTNGFDKQLRYPEPYVPRALTFEIPERVDSEGSVVSPLDEEAARAVLGKLDRLGVEAVAVCFLWSIVQGEHESRMGELISQELPNVPFTLSHQLNPVVREFRRASATSIDASLKPLMGSHFDEVAAGLRGRGLAGELMVATSQGGVMHVDEVNKRPIDTVKSGPSMAPIAGINFAQAEGIERDIIVCDTGGTSFDVSLVRDARVSYTRETWLGGQFVGHLTGTSSVDIRSIGSGGGSIAWIDSGGLLRVGPQSAGAEPGPACYDRGGEETTVTDAAVALGWFDPETFLGGRMRLDVEAARRVISEFAAKVGVETEQAAEAILTIANEHMVRAIQDLTVKEGVDPREAIVVAGGGAAGISVVAMVRELGAHDAIVPRAGGALSATGAQFSDVVCEFAVSGYADTGSFDVDAANAILTELDDRLEGYEDTLRERGLVDLEVVRFVDARYLHQVWELEVELPFARFSGSADVKALSEAFDAAHRRVFAVAEEGARVECLTWKARLRAKIGFGLSGELTSSSAGADVRSRSTYMDGSWRETAVYAGDRIGPGTLMEGPAIIEEPTSTIVIPPGASARLSDANCYHLEV